MRKVFTWLLLPAVFFSCKKEDKPATEEPPIPSGFTFNTIKKVSLDIQLLTNKNEPIRGVKVNFYPSDDLSTPLFTTVSDRDGKIVSELNLPTYVDTLVVDPAYIGLIRNANAVIRDNAVKGILGGTKGFEGSFVATSSTNGGGSPNGRLSRVDGTVVYSTLSPYDANGRPTVLAGSDEITARLLSFVNASLPEGSRVPIAHPDYLSPSSLTDLSIEKLADVWVTFIHEGAANTNTLGYYKYPTGHPPASLNDIDTIKYVFPNASLAGSGGSLVAGDKVWLGRFQPGVSIGFVLLQNAWRQALNVVNTGAVKFFTSDILNPETNPSLRRHAVVLYDNEHKIFLTGFEDKSREGGSDEDFNDLLFYTSSNPVDAISTENVSLVDQPDDADKDGAPDNVDEYPNDPLRAYNVYYPSQTVWGTLAFEDQWPNTGDYDMNDLVVGYHYKMVNNADNKTVEMYSNYMVRAVGGYYKKGLGIQLTCSPQAIASITGQRHTAGYLSLSSNGTESGQSKAVFFPFDQTSTLISPDVRVNFLQNQPRVNSDTAKLLISFSTPQTSAQLGLAPFNPFITINLQRGKEVHLPGSLPTDKANTAFFGLGNDASNPTSGIYYTTNDKWPWAINFPVKFQHPTEAAKISSAYANFLNWATSNGANFPDWYQNKTGYRNASLIYDK